MRLTWKDALTTVVAGVNVAIYVAATQGADLPVVGDVRGAAGAIVLLGLVGGCALCPDTGSVRRQPAVPASARHHPHTPGRDQGWDLRW
ncbi:MULTISPECIES: hypothetical protein [Nonomuraea]|uniref:Holin n=1 Tax=Nonomuraea salmonea TaxID=46181 RepID=A0ABV5NHN7_9ACTN